MKKLTVKIPEDRDRLYSVIHYPAGEIQVRLTASGLKACRGKDAYEIVCNPIPDIIELAQLKDALDARGGWEEKVDEYSLDYWYEKHLFLPYMPYARADRRFVQGDSFGLLVWARLLDALDFTAIWTFDVHSGKADKLFTSGLSNILPTTANSDQLTPIIKKIGRKGLILIVPDEGAYSRYRDITVTGSKKFPPVAVGAKVRDAATGKLTGFRMWMPSDEEMARQAKKALIVDDICDGGGTFIGLAAALRKINPELELYLYVSHGIFSKGTAELLKHFKRIFVSQYSFKGRHQLIWPPLGVTQLGAK